MSTDRERAWQLLEATPEEVRDNGLYKLRRACLLTYDGHDEDALELLADLAEDLPHDAAVYSQQVDCLLRLERAGEALQVLEAAPNCYKRFAYYWVQLARIKGGEPLHKACGSGPFRGQPNLGGLLIAEGECETMNRIEAAYAGNNS